MSDFSENGANIKKITVCNKCKNYKTGESCEAFKFIPNLILSGENKHKKPLPGQENKIVFEPLNNA